MPDNLIAKLMREGKLIKQHAGFIQIEALLKQAVADLEDAKKTLKIADKATYILAYMAMLKAGRAILLLNGYRPGDGAQHRTVVEMTGAILGDRYSSVVGHFETMRRKRNDMTYEAGTILTHTETEEALSDAIILVRGILKDVKSKNPQLELGL